MFLRYLSEFWTSTRLPTKLVHFNQVHPLVLSDSKQRLAEWVAIPSVSSDVSLRSETIDMMYIVEKDLIKLGTGLISANRYLAIYI